MPAQLTTTRRSPERCGEVDRGGDVTGGGDVGGREVGALPDFLGGHFPVGRRKVEQHDLGAALVQGPGGGVAESGCSAGDDSDGSIDLHKVLLE